MTLPDQGGRISADCATWRVSLSLRDDKAVTSVAVADELSVVETLELLQVEKDAVLIDVRTAAEWTYVGVPVLDGIGKRPVFIEWQSFPSAAVDPQFVEKLGAALKKNGATEATHLCFICRSGARSGAAARAMANAGYRRCHNVKDGFEGPLNSEGHRGTVAGWLAAGLPWAQG
jgi:rhodanese-related sulfurtransferase